MPKSQHAISPTRAQDYPRWYQKVIQEADLAEHAPVRGCMIIKPTGYAIWESIQQELDKQFKATGHQNVYFPLLIPLSYLEQEARHVDGFAKECAVVTHHRLEATENGLKPAAALEEPLIIRPTSETIVGKQFAKWIQSYRDLPLLINQWANVMRWEMRTRLFLRTSEFLWQEGHTAHATPQEAVCETRTMLTVYQDFCEQFLAMPVVAGEKTPEERFPGAESTFTIEAMMQDKKALQAGTSHFLGQNFSRSFDICFTDQSGQQQYAWTTSWGVSTRLIGGLIMTHSDDDGLVLPPRIAPTQVAIVPILRKSEADSAVLAYCHMLHDEISQHQFAGNTIRCTIDDRPINGGEKNWQLIKRGIPIRLEIGPRDMANGSVMLTRRDTSAKEKVALAHDQVVQQLPLLLQQIQDNLYQTAQKRLDDNTAFINTRDDFIAYFSEQGPGGFAICPCNMSTTVSEILKPMGVTARCIPQNKPHMQSRQCLFTNTPCDQPVLFAKAY